MGAALNPVVLGLALRRNGAEAVEKTHFSHASVGQQPFFSLGFFSWTVVPGLFYPNPVLTRAIKGAPGILYVFS